jgi:L,D-peptidoglycan transpeptidase YkuD (ErfK/YbiS/YcfS/YnhG family)
MKYLIIMALTIATLSCGTTRNIDWNTGEVVKLKHEKLVNLKKESTRNSYMNAHGHREVAVFFGDRGGFWKPNRNGYSTTKIGIWTMKEAWRYTKDLSTDRNIEFWYMPGQFEN